MQAQSRGQGHGGRELGRAAETAPRRVEGRLDLSRGPVQGLGLRQALAGGNGPAGPLNQLGELTGLGGYIAAPVPPGVVHCGHDLAERGHAAPGPVRVVGAAVERLAVGGQEHGHGPAAPAGEGLDRVHVDGVHVGPLLPVHLHVDEQLVHHRSGVWVLEGLVGHHVAPVAARVADRQQHGPVPLDGGGEGLGAPRVPVDRVVAVLAQVGAGLAVEPVHGPILDRGPDSAGPVVSGHNGPMSPGVRVLVVDDEPAYRDGLRAALGAEGFAVDVAADGEEALRMFDSQPPDLVLLDVMLPRISGIDVCRRIRAADATPVIMVSARSSEIDTVVGLEIGADDYVAKPYRVRELVARMRTVLRRAEARPGAAEPDGFDDVLAVGDVTLDRDRYEVTVAGRRVDLPLKEFEVLALLMENAGRVVTRETLIDRVWGFDYVGSTKTLDVHIKRLRSRIDPDRSKPEPIVTIRGLGYKYAV